MIYLVYLALVAGFILVFIGLIPKEPDTISVFGEKIKEDKSVFLSPILRAFAPLNKIVLKFLDRKSVV